MTLPSSCIIQTRKDPALTDTPLPVLSIPLRPLRLRRLWALAAVLGLGLALLAGAWAHARLERAAFQQLAARGANTLGLAVAALDGQLRRYDRLPALLAQDPAIHAVLGAPQDSGRIAAANLYLRATARLLQASDIYVMALDGTTLAASNFDQPHSFVGGNFAFRPYFRDALALGQGRFYALGTTSRVRGYYFGAPVLVDDEAAGVMVIKIDLDAIEAGWRGAEYEVIVTDPEGIVFMSTHPDWTFGATEALTDERIERTTQTRRYAGQTPHDLPIRTAPAPDGGVLWRFESGDEYRVVAERMAQADWTVQVLLSTAPARQQALTRLALAALLAGLGVLAVVVVAQWRLRLRERLALQEAAQAELEGRVIERTAELAAVNAQLAGEVAERTAAEARLRAMQAELVQAGKLAALGQMSAALSHEFNQPLGAARNYAENAQLLIDRGRLPEAGEALGRIQALIDRMADLSKHLRNFARKPNAQLSDVSLPEALEAAMEILGWRLRAMEVALVQEVPALVVRAGPVRLQQVLVNILSNALDAMEGQASPALRITARTEGAEALLTIADSGPGVPAQLIERIFDPFFSTKGVGKGLGLGLSISYNIVHDFGGTLTVANAPEGGAVFTIALPLVTP